MLNIILNNDMTVSIDCEQVQFAAGHQAKVLCSKYLNNILFYSVEFADGYVAQMSSSALTSNFSSIRGGTL